MADHKQELSAAEATSALQEVVTKKLREIKNGGQDATHKGEVQEGGQSEHPRTDALGSAATSGGGDRAQSGASEPSPEEALMLKRLDVATWNGWTLRAFWVKFGRLPVGPCDQER